MNLKKIIFPISIVLILCLLIPFFASAQRAAKKHKNAPEETIVIFIGDVNTTLNESQFPNLRFFYLPDITFEQKQSDQKVKGKYPIITTYNGSQDFIVRWGSKKHIGDSEVLTAIVVDNSGTVAYHSRYGKALIKSSYGDMDWTILTKPRKAPDKELLDEYLASHVNKGKSAKVDNKKEYTEGVEPTFKGWEDGNIDGMKLPDFNVKSSDGAQKSIYDVINGKASLIVFTGIDSAVNYGSSDEASEKLKDEAKEMSARDLISGIKAAASNDAYPVPLLWHIENILYNYYPPRK